MASPRIAKGGQRRGRAESRCGGRGGTASVAAQALFNFRLSSGGVFAQSGVGQHGGSRWR